MAPNNVLGGVMNRHADTSSRWSVVPGGAQGEPAGELRCVGGDHLGVGDVAAGAQDDALARGDSDLLTEPLLQQRHSRFQHAPQRRVVDAGLGGDRGHPGEPAPDAVRGAGQRDGVGADNPTALDDETGHPGV
jgi:hypothetical protein